MDLNLDQIRDILDAFEERNMQTFKLKQGEFEITLERNSAGDVIASTPYIPQMHALPPQALPPAQASAPVVEAAPQDDANAKYITSPMVGTLYTAASPGDPAFVKVGDTVKEGQVVCIVEAMKVMNEVKSTESGVVKELLIDNGHPVEFGTKLFKLG